MRVEKIIYTISHPITKAVVYVGITQNMEVRIKCHYSNPSPELKPFIDDLKANGLYPIITEIDRGQHELEAAYIRKFVQEGHNLVNKNSIAWYKLAVVRTSKPLVPKIPKTVFVEDELWDNWMAKKGSRDISRIARACKKSRESIRIYLLSRELPPDVFEVAKAYYDSIPDPVPPQIILCKCCEIEKEETAFRSIRSQYCRECLKNRKKDVRLIQQREYHKKHGYKSQIAYNQRNKEKNKEYMRQYHKTYVHPDPEKRKAQHKAAHDKSCSELKDSYVKALVKREGLPADAEIIELKRKSLELKRQLKEIAERAKQA